MVRIGRDFPLHQPQTLLTAVERLNILFNGKAACRKHQPLSYLITNKHQLAPTVRTAVDADRVAALGYPRQMFRQRLTVVVGI
ncbi:hypothetical protein ABW09_19760 [Pluralibacter gergoviae]|nr:hypothetical protein ABW09_19760 [Pluralibacter gergoviae]